MQTLTDINLVNFNNVERYNKNDNNETLQAFVDLVNANARFSSLPEVVSNLNANNNRINITVKTMTTVKQLITDIRDICTKASDESFTTLQRDGYHAQMMDRLIQSQRIQAESKYNGLNNFKTFNPHPSTLKPSGDTVPSDYSDLFTTYANPATQLVDGTAPVDYEDIGQVWKAQVGFDTGSILNYTILRWGPKFMEIDSSGSEYFNFKNSDTVTAHIAASKAESAIDVLQKEEVRLQKDIANLQSVYSYLERQQSQVKSDHEAAIRSIEDQRASAKKQLENQLKNQIRQIEYLNLVVGYRPN